MASFASVVDVLFLFFMRMEGMLIEWLFSGKWEKDGFGGDEKNVVGLLWMMGLDWTKFDGWEERVSMGHFLAKTYWSAPKITKNVYGLKSIIESWSQKAKKKQTLKAWKKSQEWIMPKFGHPLPHMSSDIQNLQCAKSTPTSRTLEQTTIKTYESFYQWNSK